MSDEILKMTWDELDTLHRKVAAMIQGEFAADVVVGISRCGMVSAVHLAYILGIRVVLSVSVQTTITDDALSAKLESPIIRLHFDEEDIRGKNVLLVDTVMASGSTIKDTIKRIHLNSPSELKVAVVVDWPNSPYNKPNITRPLPDFIGTTVLKWPDFPWES